VAPEPLGDLPHLVREPRGEPLGALVLLHGRGADEADLHPLLEALDPDERLLGITPGAPIVGLAPGGRHWYAVQRVGFPHEETFSTSMPVLRGFVEGALAARGIPWSRTIVGGFSQGAVMSYALTLGPNPPRPAGVLALSGFLPTVPSWPLEPADAVGVTYWVSHGSSDEVIPVDFGREAARTLEDAGLDVTYLESGVAHSIDPGLLVPMREWVESALDQRPETAPTPD